jgi:hypothetical protein
MDRVSPTIADQTVEQLGGPTSVLVRQRRDHERLNVLLRRIRETEGEAQDEAITAMCRLAFPHAFAEEAILWPAIRRAVPSAEEMTLEVEQEHQEINEILSALDRSRRGDAGRPALIERALELLDQDVRDEEDDLLPRYQEAVDARELQRVGLLWELVRRTAPTRSHPVVARRPPGNVLSALPLSAIDRTRDVLDRFERRSDGSLADASRHASRSLAAVAGIVEHMPLFTRGEDPSTNRT